MTEPAPEEIEDQVERTLLAWRRTALSLVAAGLLIGHLTADRTGLLAVVLPLLGIAVVVAFVWLGHVRSTGVSAAALLVGVSLLGAVALVGVAAH